LPNSIKVKNIKIPRKQTKGTIKRQDNYMKFGDTNDRTLWTSIW